MLYNILTNYSDTYSFLNLFDFLTVRTGLAVITSMLIVFLIGDKFINYFSTKKLLIPSDWMDLKIILLKKLVHLQWEVS